VPNMGNTLRYKAVKADKESLIRELVDFAQISSNHMPDIDREEIVRLIVGGALCFWFQFAETDEEHKRIFGSLKEIEARVLDALNQEKAGNN
jgi:hypothetical protein